MDNQTLEDNERMVDVMDEETVFEEEDYPRNQKENVGFWYRVIAYIIDIVIISSISGILLSPLMLVNNGIPFDIGFWTLNGILATMIYYVYFFFLTKLFQQTLGKMIVGIKVVQQVDEQLSWSDVFFREIIGRIIHNVFFFLKLLYLLVAFTKEKQGFHDMIGNTRVVFI